MASVTRVQFPSVTEFLGWHGTFLLGTIVIFKLLLDSLGASACPCTGHIFYGTFMLGIPAFSIFLVAFFSYFYQKDTKSPWKDLKAYFKLKWPCSYSPTSQSWELHSGVFHQCTECQGKWHKIKITISFFISWVYPLLWLALGFRQVTYYACANVGPDPRGILRLCDNWKDSGTYDKKYTLATYKSVLVGNVLFVIVIALASAIFVTYRLIRSKIADIPEDAEGNHDHEQQNRPVDNFGHTTESMAPDARMPGAMLHSTEVAPASGASYEGFRELSGEMSGSRVAPQDTKPLIKIDA